MSKPSRITSAQTTATQATTRAETGFQEQQFLRLMSHEMRTPLNGVIGMLGLLSRTRLDGAQRAYAEAAQKSAEHLLGLVNDLLDYARLEAGALEFDLAPVDPENLTRSVAELLSPRAHERDLEIVWSVAPDVPHIIADEGRLRQVLFNLAGNAVKFTDEGGVHIQVKTCGGTTTKPKVCFIIDDNGPGVPPEARTRIFEEFGHADQSDAVRHDGAGLGLAVVRRLAEAMNGSVRVEDRPDGQGARFLFEAAFKRADTPDAERPLHGHSAAILSPSSFVRASVEALINASGGQLDKHASVTLVDHALAAEGERAARPQDGQSIILLRPSQRDLIADYKRDGFHGYLIKPLRRESLAQRVLAASPHTDKVVPVIRHLEDDRLAEGNFKGVRVLLVEDNPVGQLLAKTLLRREGCLVQTAADGYEALTAAGSHLFDIIFMDMRMPRLDGVSATRLMRAQGLKTPIIALTANAYSEDRTVCLEAGMDDHLSKPLELESLRIALGRWTKAPNHAKFASNSRN